jgi:hypothetical protein
MAPVSYHEANGLVAGYVCADCWGPLSAHPVDDGVDIHCGECGAATPGFVSMRYTEKRKSESLAQYYLARKALREAVPWFFPAKKVPDQLLKDLGY